MHNSSDLTKNALKIGVDAQAFAVSEQFPVMLFHFCYRYLSALLEAAPSADFIFFTADEKAENVIRSLFPGANVRTAPAGTEAKSQLSFYLMPDQLSLSPSRPPPLMFAPRNLPISLFVHNMLAVSSADTFFKKWPDQVALFHLQAIEMISASPAHIFCPSEFEARLVHEITSTPIKQISGFSAAAAVPRSFVPSESRWGKLKSRLEIPDSFIVSPSDTLSDEGNEELYQHWQALRKIDAKIALVRPAMREFLAAYLPAPDRPQTFAPGIIFEPQITYEEFLELLSRSLGYLLPGSPFSFAGAPESNALKVPVYGTKPLDPLAQVPVSLEDFVIQILSYSERTGGKTYGELEAADLNEAWLKIARTTVEVLTERI